MVVMPCILLHSSKCCPDNGAGQGGSGGSFKHMMDIAGVEISLICLSAIKENMENIQRFRLRDD